MSKPSPALPRYLRFDTLSLHAGQQPDPQFGARATPIYQSTSFVFKDSDHAASLFNMERGGHVYSRISNPTNAVLEERIAALEGGVGAIAVASGQAAHAPRHRHLARCGLPHRREPLAVRRLAQPARLHPAPLRHRDDVRRTRAISTPGARAIRPHTRLIFGETLGNPGLDVLDVPAVAEIAHAAKLPLLVDSTFTTPYLMRPFDLGADLLFHSATKFLSGHGIVIGGLLVDAGAFDWEASGKYPTLTEPYAGFHGMDFSEESTMAAFLLRARREGLRDFGACMAPTTAFQILQGIETLPLRMQRHVDNTRKIVEFLCQAARGRGDRLPRARDRIRTMRWRRSCCRAAAARCSASRSRAGGRRAASSSRPCGCSRISPTSAMPNRS